jgi:serine phosphatase RsbU (regulator of sigma subunit)
MLKLNKITKSIPLVLSAFLVFLFYEGQNFFHSPNDLVENNPLVINLKNNNTKTKIRIGNSPQCKTGECWIQKIFLDDDWTTKVLPLNPNENITTFENYTVNSRTSNKWAYYRTELNIPSKLIESKDEISFCHVFILHSKYEVYLNGRQIYVSDGRGLGRIGNFPIPKKDIVDGKVTFVIKGTLAPEDRGIAHFGATYLGPKSILDSVYLFSERTTYSFFLLFLLTKGAIFVVFALFYFFSNVHSGFKNFLGFAFFVTIENLFMGEFFADTFLTFGQRVLLTYGCKSLSVACLLSFFVNFFQNRRLKLPALIFNIAAVSLVLGLAYDFNWGSKQVTFKVLWDVSNTYLITVIGAAVVLGIICIKSWIKNDAKGTQLNTYIYVTVFVSLYFILSIDAFYFKAYSGYESRNLFDLGFFFVLATITAKNMGSQQQEITALEGHMEDKARMELELQEAAEIAKAFLPDELPFWRDFNISSFHKPLTENSGDWFAFEKSSSGKYYHYIMCDITGHGVQAAIVVSTCKSVLSTFTHSNINAMESKDFILNFMIDLNWTLFNNGNGQHVSTLLGLTFSPDENKVFYICAGHPSPIYLDGKDEEPKPKVLVSRNNVLGINAAFKGVMKSEDFFESDQLITYTDGLLVGSNTKAFKKFIRDFAHEPGSRFQDLPTNLAHTIGNAEFSKSNSPIDDDVSIVWFEKLKSGA